MWAPMLLYTQSWFFGFAFSFTKIMKAINIYLLLVAKSGPENSFVQIQKQIPIHSLLSSQK